MLRLKDELKMLRKMYEDHMRLSEENLKMTYEKKVQWKFEIQINVFNFRFLILKYP